MSERKDWVCALSVGPAAMNDAELTALHDSGIREVELSSGNITPFYEVLDFTHKSKEIAALAHSHGVNISSVHLPFAPFSELDPASLDAEVRKNIAARQTELIRAAGEAGIKIAVIHPSGEPYKDEERGERLDIAIDVIGGLAENAEKEGVCLALENLPRTCLCRIHDEMKKFLDAIPGLRVCFDTNHSLTEDNAEYIAAVTDKIVTLHISDYDFADERHWLPGRGKNDWERIISALESANYRGRWLYELRGGEGTYAEIFENYKKLTNT